MKRGKIFSILMGLLIVLSTFTIVDAAYTTTEVCETKGWIDFEKMVWNDDEGDWWDFTWAEIGDTVVFNITLTYHKDEANQEDWTLHHIKIMDELPECLEFANNVVITTNGSSPITYTEDIVGDMIVWNFSDYEPMLYDGESLFIEFDANVIVSSEIENENIAYVEANECNVFDHQDDSSAWVYVDLPENVFEKKVLDGDVWSEITNTTVGSTVTFKINLVYYGIEYLHDIKIVDYLPCCLDYADNANIEPSNVSDDLKTIWWNMTDILTYGESIVLTFDALVTGTTGCGCDGINTATVDAEDGCGNIPYIAEDDAKINATCGDPNVPPCWPFVSGDTSGMVGEELSFYVETYDYNEDDVYYWVEWGDGTNTGWIGPYPSGLQVELSYSYSSSGNYEVKAMAKDIHDAESIWGNTHIVVIISNNPPSAPVVDGDASGEVEEELSFNVVATDPEGEDIFYWIDWGDGTNTGWIGPSSSGVPVESTHSWDTEGNYEIKAKAKDINEAESSWGSPHLVEINALPNISANLKIRLKAISLGKVSATIENIGQENVTVDWTISMTGGVFRLLIKRITAYANGTIENLGVGGKQTVSTQSGSIKRRFGLAKVTVYAVVGDDLVEHNQYVLVLGRIILARPLLLRR
jgi:fimbrial isopeptide formation D2 family protein